MARTLLIAVLTTLACACTQLPSIKPPASPASPAPAATQAPPAVPIVFSFDGVKVFTYKDETLQGSDVKQAELPLASLVASASDSELSDVGLIREESTAALVKWGWRLHRRVTTFRQREDEAEPRQDTVTIWPRLNLAFLASGSPTIAMDNIVEGNLDKHLKAYATAISDGVSEAGEEIASATGLNPSWETSTQAPTIGEGVLSIFAVTKLSSSRLPRRVTSTVVGDMMNVQDAVASLEGIGKADILWMEGMGFPSHVISAFIRMRVRERVAQQLFEGLGIDNPWPVRSDGPFRISMRPNYSIVVGTASGSVLVGSTVAIRESTPTDATGSYTVQPSDLVFEEGDTVYIQTSTDPADEHEARSSLGKLARFAAQKLLPTLKK